MLVPNADDSTYCIEGTHAKLTAATDVWSLQPGGILDKVGC